MNGKASKGIAPTTPRYNNTVFVNYELSVDEKAHCKVWLEDILTFDGQFQRFISDGYKTSVKWDEKNNAFACYVTHPKQKFNEADLLLTGRGSTPCKAIKQAMFKHYVVFDCEWGGYAERLALDPLDD